MEEPNRYKGYTYLKKTAFFMAGFSLLLTLRVALNGASFCLVRFQIEEDLFSVYVSRVHNAMELCCFIAVVLGNVYVISYGKYVKYISIAISWLFYLTNIALMGSFVTGGNDGYLTRFYWTLSISAIVYGFNQVCIFKLGGKDIVYFLAAVPMSGIFTSVYQLIFLKFFGDRAKYKTDFLLITFQIGLSIMFTLIAAALWTLVFLEPDIKDTEDEAKDIEKNERSLQLKAVKSESESKEKSKVSFAVISPILMCVFGLGLVYAFYPGVAPGMLVNFKYVHKIDVVIMILSSLPSAIVALISELTKYGPNNKWEGVNAFWHGFLIFVLIEIVCGIIFFRVLHYKRTSLSKFILNKPVTAGIFTVLFHLCHSISIGVGFAGVEPNSNSTVSTFNLFLALLAMNTFEFLGEGYVVEVKKYTVFNWPTVTMNDWEAFGFWLKNAAINAGSSLMSTFTTDLRSDLISSITESLD